ncbi:MAG: gluconeogenesis factor YvcK family protein [bacterium]
MKKCPNIVCVGGGTGQAAVLRGLKKYPVNITAVVTVTDSGRSSGRIRREQGILPPGDIRNCLVSLASSEKILKDLFQYRFRGGDGLDGMSFGNLFIAALTKITGSFDKAVRETSKILAIQGKVLPSTLQDTHICAELDDKTIIEEEFNIRCPNKRPISRVFLKDEGVKSSPECIDALLKADLIVLGPGSLYTSVICNLLIKDIQMAIKKSRAIKVYICNLMTHPGQTDDYTANKHVEEVVRYLGEGVLDYVIINRERPEEKLLKRYYREEGATLLQADINGIKALGITPIVRNIVDKSHDKMELWQKQDLLRHDPHKLAKILIKLYKGEIPKKRVDKC